MGLEFRSLCWRVGLSDLEGFMGLRFWAVRVRFATFGLAWGSSGKREE